MKKVLLQATVLICVLFFLAPFNSFSQAKVQGGIFVSGPNVQINIKPTGDINTASFVTNVVFTVKCANTAQTATLGAGNINFVTNPYGFGVLPVVVSGGFRYLTFTAAPLTGASINWTHDSIYPLVTFKITGLIGRVNMELSDDNPPNAPWYFEIGGVDYTPPHFLPPFDQDYFHRTTTGVPIGLVADFGIQPVICQNWYTNFTNLSLGTTAFTTYEFDFDGPGLAYTWTGASTCFNCFSHFIYTNTIPTSVTLRIVDGAQVDVITKPITIVPQPATPIAQNNGPVCVGNNIFLTSTFVSNASYRWFRDTINYLPTIFTIQNPLAIVATNAMVGVPQLYGVTVTVNGCESTPGWTRVDVNAPVTVDAGNNINVCNSSPANVNGTVSGGGTGHWYLISSPVNYSTDAIILPANQTNLNAPLITTLVPGTYILQLVNTTPNTCPANDQVIVQILPTPATPSLITSNSPVCEGGVISLSVNTPVTGLTYQWTGPGGWNATGSTVTRPATLAAGGAYTVIAGTGTCNSSPSSPINVVVNPLPVVDAGQTINIQCAGTAANLNGSISAGTATWSLVSGPTGMSIFDLINIANISNPTAPLNTGSVSLGTYNLKLTSVLNGCSASDLTDVTINHPSVTTPGVVTSNSPVCDGGTISLSVGSPVTGLTYEWNGPGGWNATGSTVTRPAFLAATGAYTVTASNGTCTSAPSSGVSVTVNPLPTVDAGPTVNVQCQGTIANLSGTVIIGPEVLDQSQTVGGFYVPGNYSQWQSFTAGMTGNLTRIWVSFVSASAGTLSIYSGTGTSGSLLGSQAVSLGAGSNFIVLSIPVYVITGSVYTIGITGTDQWIIGPGDPYSGGTSWFGSSWDETFQTFVTPSGTDS